MDQTILNFIQSQRVGVLAVEMLDGSPHGATVHFAHTETPFVFYFETHYDYKKSEALLGRETSRASLVVGFDETVMKTLQLDGQVRRLKGEEKEIFQKVYLAKFPNRAEKQNDPGTILFTFTPTWWRFTDWKGKDGKTIITSS